MKENKHRIGVGANNTHHCRIFCSQFLYLAISSLLRNTHKILVGYLQENENFEDEHDGSVFVIRVCGWRWLRTALSGGGEGGGLVGAEKTCLRTLIRKERQFYHSSEIQKRTLCL
jgi:hypothetical protein